MALEAVQAQAGHRQHRVDPRLPAPDQRLAGRGVPARRRADRRRQRPRSLSCSPCRRPPGERRRPRAGRAAVRAALRRRGMGSDRGRSARRSPRSMRRYLRAAGARSWPRRSVDAAENALRQLARWMTDRAPGCDGGRRRSDAIDIEDFKLWLATQPRRRRADDHDGAPTGSGCGPLRSVLRADHRVGLARRPPRNPVIDGDIPKKTEPLPKFLDDRDAAKLMAAPGPQRITRPARDGAAGAHGACARANRRSRSRRGRPDRHRLLAANPARQAPQRPIRPAPRGAGRAARRLDGRQPRTHPRANAGSSPTIAARWTATGIDRIVAPRRSSGRRRRRPPAPAATHARDPGDQPRHAPRGNRRATRPPERWR